MTKQRIRWIAVLMTVGLLGLISLQLYWIDNALSLQKEQFDYKVTDGLQEVVRTLERKEILYLARQRMNQQQQQRQLIAISRPTVAAQSLNNRDQLAKAASRFSRKNRKESYAANPPNETKPVVSEPESTNGTVPVKVWQQTQVSPSDAFQSDVQKLSEVQQRHFEDLVRQQDALGPDELWDLQLQQQRHFNTLVDQVFERQLRLMYAQPDSVLVVQKPLKKEQLVRKLRPKRKVPVPPAPTVAVSSSTVGLQKVEQQSEMVKGVVRDLLFASRPIESRINRTLLDSLLKESIAERGITIPFEYGVRTNVGMGLDKPQLLFASHSDNQMQGKKKIYKAVLFPNNFLEKGNYVYVYFPDQQQFILRKMSAILAGSAVLVLVIMACFYIAINTIMRQKKLADIKNDFINNMTHEFKTPISTISLAVEMAQEQLSHGIERSEEPATRLTRYMGIIRDETRRLGTHVEKVLQMALLDRATAGKGAVKLKLSSVNIHDAIGNVLNTIGLQIEQKEGEVHLDFEAAEEIVEADELHLSNILYNLLDNAIKYSPEKPDITIRTRNVENGVSITVADHGIGMTKDQVSRIFEKFYRVPTGNLHDVKGFGLGLSYVKKMVEEHHGSIRVDSQLGKGSSFELVLPYQHT
ncbi:sensor histidine kinase [Larkinella humicola]|uniref:histidine kinase n=1 Tax=Larkinella humicola TaxID=2607654 RepID=A0A5N1JCX7_9BACT|nr:HAMP domain-containing sensor histidine kinase [Larkinella humicola]KAA9353154.1 HAMP domain-containing histidine kinase [Larkinella humicola]